MKVIEKISELRSLLEEARVEGKKVGAVPTMGAIHEGHLTLVRSCKEEMDLTIVTIFVNPTQFNEAQDFENYPKTVSKDLETLESLGGVDVVFIPETSDMYPPGSQVTVEAGPAAHLLCGLSRPGHFRGVLTVVIKLFNIIGPDAAFFGAKDYQQFNLIAMMVKDLNLPIELRMIPTVREEDGLAMSSRNTRLTPGQREEAPILFQTLEMGQRMIRKGESQAMEVIAAMMNSILENSLFEIDYLSIVDPLTLEDITEVKAEMPYLIAIAANMGPIRLIDNLLNLPRQ
jgi:pantoate--beta-alanine ligase